LATRKMGTSAALTGNWAALIAFFLILTCFGRLTILIAARILRERNLGRQITGGLVLILLLRIFLIK